MRGLGSSLFALAVIFAALGAPAEEVVLFEDGFSSYAAGAIGTVVGAHTEYHYIAEAAPRGPWAISTFRSDPSSQLAWAIVAPEGKKILENRFENKMKHTHPMVVAGDDLWQDYTLEVRFRPQNERRTGIVFRYATDRSNYFFGVEKGRALLLRVNNEKEFRVMDELVLGEAACDWKNAGELTARVIVAGNKFSAELVGLVKLEATDDAFPQGRIALQADGSAQFLSVRVTASPEELAHVQAEHARLQQEEQALQSANPKPVLWKKISTEGFGVGRNLRFGDLDGDGQIDVLAGQVLHHGPKDTNSELSCLTAVTFEGKQLWQVGEADLWKNHLTNDVAFQIHDLDGDGKNEVVYAKDMKLIVAEGATGKTLKEVDTPAMPAGTKVPYDKFPRVLGDSMYFCDFRGTGRDSDIVLKDRYASFWVFDQDLKPLWSAQCNTGHYPYAADIDGDGKDELAIGYSLYDDDGKVLWTLDDKIQDHADGVALYRPQPDQPWRLLCAASDEGIFFADMQGNVLKHHRLGHVQNPAIADFREDLPGLEAVSVNFWGNQGIIHFFDAEGEVYKTFEPFQHGSMCLPVNWTGKAPEYVMLSANTETGGLYDGWGRHVVRLPADGHPEMAYDVLNITGDAREELVVWDPYEVWVYTQDKPAQEPVYAPERNGTYNASNYLTIVSTPAP